MAEVKYKRGTQVEVSNRTTEGLHRAWYTATVLWYRDKGKNIRVVYHGVFIFFNGESKPHKETVNSSLVRPFQPQDSDQYSALAMHQKVEAFFNGAWWAGVISKVLESSRYMMRFQTSQGKVEIEYERSNLRVSLDWIDGQWVSKEMQENFNKSHDLGGTNSTNQENLLQASNTVHIAEVQPDSQGEACQEGRRKRLKGREGKGMVMPQRMTTRQSMRAIKINALETRDLLGNIKHSTSRGRAKDSCPMAGTSTVNNQHEEEEAGQQNETHQMPLSNIVLIDLTHDELPPNNNNNNIGLPFVKCSQAWETIESMEAFHTMPQRPHFNPLKKYCEQVREGKAIGYMVSFANLVDKIYKLRLEDPRDILEDKLNALVELEQHGFDVQRVQARLEDLIRIKDEQRQAKEKRSMVIGKILERKCETERIGTEIQVLDAQIKLKAEELAEMVQSRNRLQGRRALVHTEIDELRMEMQAAQGEHHKAFSSLVIAPW